MSSMAIYVRIFLCWGAGVGIVVFVVEVEGVDGCEEMEVGGAGGFISRFPLIFCSLLFCIRENS